MADPTNAAPPTPDVTATAPTAQTTTPDYTQTTQPAQLTPQQLRLLSLRPRQVQLPLQLLQPGICPAFTGFWVAWL